MAVARLDEAGVDVIKVMATGGNLTPGSAPHESQFGLAELRAVVEAAHAAGLPVAAHAHSTQGVSDALDARVDTIEHCSFMTADGVAEDATLVRRLASSGVTVSITGGTIPGPIPPAIAVRMPALAAHGRRMLAAGVRCIISTDAGIGPAKPHDVLARTVEHAVEDLGATVDEALAMCTARAAEGIGLGHKAGRCPDAPRCGRRSPRRLRSRRPRTVGHARSGPGPPRWHRRLGRNQHPELERFGPHGRRAPRLGEREPLGHVGAQPLQSFEDPPGLRRRTVWTGTARDGLEHRGGDPDLLQE